MSIGTNTLEFQPLAGTGLFSSRSRCLLVYPAILLGTAVLAVGYQSSITFGITAFAIAFIGILAFGELLFGSSTINCGKVIAVGLSMAYGLTSFNTWWNVRDVVGGLPMFVEADQGTLCNGIALVSAVVASLFVIGEAFPFEIRVDVRELAATGNAKWFVLTSFLIVVAAFVHGDLTYMGQQVSADYKITVLGSLGAWLVPPLFGMTFAVANRTHDRLQKILFWTVFACQAVMIIPLGRRVFIYTLFIGGLVAKFSVVRREGLLLKRVVFVAVALVGMYVASISFLYIRFATYELDPKAHHSLGEILSTARDLSSRKDYKEVAVALKENTLERGFILGFLADLMKQAETHETAGGQDAINQIIILVPSVVWADKSSNLPPAEEDLANSIFGTNYPDSANTMLTAGVVDFGLAGAFIYAFIAAAIITVFLMVMAAFARPITSASINLSAIYLMLNTEQYYGDYLGFVRNSLVFAFILYLISMARPALKRNHG